MQEVLSPFDNVEVISPTELTLDSTASWGPLSDYADSFTCEKDWGRLTNAWPGDNGGAVGDGELPVAGGDIAAPRDMTAQPECLVA